MWPQRFNVLLLFHVCTRLVLQHYLPKSNTHQELRNQHQQAPGQQLLPTLPEAIHTTAKYAKQEFTRTKNYSGDSVTEMYEKRMAK